MPPPDDMRFDATSLIDPADITLGLTTPTQVPRPTAPAPSAFKPPTTEATGATAVPLSQGKQRGSLVAVAAAVLVGALAVGGWASGLLSGAAASNDVGVAESLAEDSETLSALDYGSFKALVIGIDDYVELQDLKTAVRDARKVASVLEDRYGFEVTLVENASRAELLSAMEDVGRTLTSRDSLLVYYAGHGRGRRQRAVLAAE